MKFSIYIYLLIIFSSILSCNNNEVRISINNEVENKNCIKIRDSAYSYMLNYSKDKTLDLNISLKLYDKAIQCDSTFYLAYHEKFSLLVMMDSLEDALIQLNKIFDEFNINTYQLYEEKSALYKRLDKLDSANFYSKKAFKLLAREVNQSPDSIPLMQDFVLYATAIKGKSIGLRLIDSLLNKHPNLIEINQMKDFIINFDSLKYSKTGLFY